MGIKNIEGDLYVTEHFEAASGNFINTLNVEGDLLKNSENVLSESEVVTKVDAAVIAAQQATSELEYTAIWGPNLEKVVGYVCEGRRGINKDIVIPSVHKGVRVIQIGQNAFSNSDITSIKIPSTVSFIEKRAFENCTALKRIFIPKTVSSISGNVFAGCSNLTIYLEATEIPNSWINNNWNPDNRPVVLGCVASFEDVSEFINKLAGEVATDFVYTNTIACKEEICVGDGDEIFITPDGITILGERVATESYVDDKIVGGYPANIVANSILTPVLTVGEGYEVNINGDGINVGGINVGLGSISVGGETGTQITSFDITVNGDKVATEAFVADTYATKDLVTAATAGLMPSSHFSFINSALIGSWSEPTSFAQIDKDRVYGIKIVTSDGVTVGSGMTIGCANDKATIFSATVFEGSSAVDYSLRLNFNGSYYLAYLYRNGKEVTDGSYLFCYRPIFQL